MSNRVLTCIICPRGCRIDVMFDNENKAVTSVKGNMCNRGEIYAKNECINPQRTVTTTARCTDGGVVAVKTDRAIPKAKVTECMKIINKATVELPVKAGQTVIENVFGSNVVATANKGVSYKLQREESKDVGI